MSDVSKIWSVPLSLPLSPALAVGEASEKELGEPGVNAKGIRYKSIEMRFHSL